MRAAVAYRKRDVLFPVHGKADGRGARNVIQAGVPEFRTCGVVARAEPAVNGAAKYQPTGGGQNTGGFRSPLALDPNRLARFKIGGLNTPVIAVAIQAGAQARANPRGEETSFALADGSEIHAGFNQWRVQHFGFGIVS